MKKIILFLILALLVGTVSATVPFGVLGTPLENFDTNTTTGEVTYRPLNMTWLSFDGSGDRVLIERPSTLAKNISYSVWFKYSTTSVNHFLSGTASNEGIMLENGKLIFGMKNSTNKYENVSSELLYNDSTWHHVVGTYNPKIKNITLYVDGLIINSTVMGIAPSGYGLYFNLGSYGGGSNDYNGLIDEVRFYYGDGGVLSKEDVQLIYNSGRVKNDSLNMTDLSIYFSLNSKSSSISNEYNVSHKASTNGISPQSDNINLTTLGYQVNISISNITSAYIYYDNGTVWNSTDTNRFTGNLTFSFLNNQTVYILEEYLTGISGFSWTGQGTFINGSNYLSYNNSRIYKDNLVMTGMTNALLFWSNGTLINISETGDRTLSVTAKNKVNILNDFELDEASPRTLSPIWISSSTSKQRRIASNLTDTVNVNVIITRDGSWESDCSNINKVTYTTHSGVETIWKADQARSVCKALTSTGYILSIEPASASNKLDFEIGTTSLATTFMKILVGFLALTIFFVALSGFFVYVKNNFKQISVLEVAQWAILVLIATTIYIVLINYVLDII